MRNASLRDPDRPRGRSHRTQPKLRDSPMAATVEHHIQFDPRVPFTILSPSLQRANLSSPAASDSRASRAERIPPVELWRLTLGDRPPRLLPELGPGLRALQLG